MGMDQPLFYRKTERTGICAEPGTIPAAQRLFLLFHFGIELKGVLFQPVVFVIHRVAQDIVDGHSPGTGRETFSTAYPAILTPRFALILRNGLQVTPFQGLS